MPRSWKESMTHPVVVAAALTIFRLFYGQLPKDGSRFLAIPIAIESGWPGTYPATDILVQSGMHSGFHLYVALGKIAALGLSLAVMWEACFLITTFLLAWLVMTLCEHLTERRDVALMSTAVLMAMPSFRGTLVWSPVPGPEFVIASLGACMLLMALLFSWQRRWVLAGLVAGLLCNLHPSLGSIAFLLLVAAGTASWTQDRVQLMRALIVGAIAALPNAYAMGRHLFDSGAAEVTTAGLFELVAPFQKQYSITDHLNDGLGFYSSMVVLALAGIEAGVLRRRRDLLSAFVAIHGLVAIYVVAVEVFQSSFIGIFFWFRATAFVKVLAIPACVLLAAHHWRGPGSAARRATLGALMLAAAFAQNETASASFLLFALAWHLAPDSRGTARATAVLLGMCAAALMVSIGWRRLGIPVSPDSIRTLLAVVGGVLPLLTIPLVFTARRATVGEAGLPGQDRVSGRWLAGTALALVFSLFGRNPYQAGIRTMLPESWSSVRARVLFEEPSGEMAEVERWARRAAPRDALFVLPPDALASERFRVRARRGVFVTIGDLAQLTYAPAAFIQARERARLAGVGVPEGRPEASGYARIDSAGADALRRAGATHLVFVKSRAPRLDLAVAFAGDAWLVYALEGRP
jgi:hypothetical protein